jgi:predicted Zn finger-like uncharacterized protein
MDVRCDRCETEYELDDDSVTEGGASVQCTTCGHTFVVGPDGVTIAQIVPTPPGGLADLGPQAADWLLATEDGQTHRFRDLTTLQKWVVERKATREDRVSQRGGPWLPLGEVDELAPFFAVVDQADRARSVEGARRSGGRDGDGLAAQQASVARPGARRRENGLGGDAMLSARVDSGPTPSLDAGSFSTEDERGDDKFETITLFRRSRNVKIAGAAGFVALAIVAAIIGFRRPEWSPVKPPAPAHAADVPPVAPAAAPAPPPAPAVTAAPPAAPAPAAAAPSSPPGTPPAPAVPAAVDPVAAAKVAPAERPGPESAQPAKPKTYERLVGEADRLMENGQPARAQKLLDEALAMQPNGVAALSGVGYLYLDRQKPLAAISTFKRALGFSPEFPQAIFGLAEAYRAQGQIALAAENYRKFISVAPGAPDAPAARRQLKEMESLLPKKLAAPESAPAKTDEPGAAAEKTP